MRDIIYSMKDITIKEAKYRPRITDGLLDFKLHSKGAVVIQGPKWVGKTTSAKRFAKSFVDFGDVSDQEQNILLARMDTKSVLQGETPRLFDEWQEAPFLWDAIRYEVDKRNRVGQFILTGSTVKIPKNSQGDIRKHTGIGRFTYLLMRPMSLFESGESNGKISLKSLFDTPSEIFAEATLSLADVAFLTCRGGWPFATFLEGDYALVQAKDYYDSIVNDDISRVDGKRRNLKVVKKLLRSYARVQAQGASTELIANDIGEIDTRTVADYIDALRRLYVIEDASAWNPNLRSKTAIRTSDTRYFVDPSIAAAALNLKPDALVGDLKYFGFLFETLAFRDLRVYTMPLEGEVSHYRDKNGLECDAVISLPDGRYGLVEIKLGQTPEAIDEAVSKMTTLRNKIDPEKMSLPSFMMVLTGNGAYAYRREDGIYVVPIGCLRP